MRAKDWQAGRTDARVGPWGMSGGLCGSREHWCLPPERPRWRVLGGRIPVRIICFLVLCVVPFSGSAALAQEVELRIIAPSLGRPAFVQQGGTLAVVIAGLNTPVEARLLHPRVEGNSYRLKSDTVSTAADSSGETLRLVIPENTPSRVYDLEIRASGKSALARHAVAVGAVGDTLRIVHLSDMNVGDIQSPEFDRSLHQEINLISPDVIVGTGDFLDAGHPRLDEGWLKLVDFLCGFDAPLVLACGDHDDAERFARHIAASAIGTVDCGGFQFVALNDHNLAPLEADAEQSRWAEEIFSTPLAVGRRIVVSHRSAPTLLRKWQKSGILKERMQRASLGGWFAGSGRDLAPRELSDVLSTIKPARFFRTGAASASIVSGGDGMARYRVVQMISKDEASAAIGPRTGMDRSFVAGRMSLRQEAVDGNDTRIGVSAINNNDIALENGGCFVRLVKSGNERPWVRGAALAQIADLGAEWECRLRFDLPGRSSMRAWVGVGNPPAEAALNVRIAVPSRLTAAAQLGEDGLIYWTSANARGAITLENRGPTALECSPLARLDGEVVAWKAEGQVEEFVASARLSLAPGVVQQLQLDLSAARVVPGSRSLVFYVNDGRTLTPVEHRVEVAQERGATP